MQITAQYVHQYLQPMQSSFSVLWQGHQSICLLAWRLNIHSVCLINVYRIANVLYFSCKNILDILDRDLRFHARGNQHLLSSKNPLLVRNHLRSHWNRKTFHGMELSFFLLYFLSKLSLMSCPAHQCSHLQEFC